MYAMKEMLKARVISKKRVEDIMKELDFLCLIKSEHIVNLEWAFHDIDFLYLVMDLMEGGNLRFHHNLIRKFPQNQT